MFYSLISKLHLICKLNLGRLRQRDQEAQKFNVSLNYITNSQFEANLGNRRTISTKHKIEITKRFKI